MVLCVAGLWQWRVNIPASSFSRRPLICLCRLTAGSFDQSHASQTETLRTFIYRYMCHVCNCVMPLNNNNELPLFIVKTNLSTNRLSHRTAMIGLISCHAGQQHQTQPVCNKGITQFYLPPSHGPYLCLYSPVARLGNHPLVPSYTAWWQRHTAVSSLPKATVQWCRGRTRTRDL